jgi:hypothetical protein
LVLISSIVRPQSPSTWNGASLPNGTSLFALAGTSSTTKSVGCFTWGRARISCAVPPTKANPAQASAPNPPAARTPSKSTTIAQGAHPREGAAAGGWYCCTMNFAPHASQRRTVPIDDSRTLNFTPQDGQCPVPYDIVSFSRSVMVSARAVLIQLRNGRPFRAWDRLGNP